MPKQHFTPTSEVDFKDKPKEFIPASWTEDHPRHGTGYRRCQAWSRRQGRQCLALSVEGTDKCRAHGGKSLRGIANPSFVNGEQSKYRPRGYKAKYERFRNDPELLSLNDDIAMITAVIAKNWEEIDTDTVSSERWMNARQVYNILMRALRINDERKINQSLVELGEVLNTGADTSAKIENNVALTDALRRLTQAESKRRLDMQSMITLEKALEILLFATSGIRTVVIDVLGEKSKNAKQILAGSEKIINSVFAGGDGEGSESAG